MAIHFTKNKIRATGNDANGLLIAMMADESLLESQRENRGSEEFQRMVNEAIEARGLKQTQ